MSHDPFPVSEGQPGAGDEASGWPSGTVTFLFTDIEGSTRRWEEERESMAAALARHDALLRSAIEARGGVVFKTVGDAFCAAFSTPSEAVMAAVDGQRGLERQDWSEVGAGIGALRVRMALHAGESVPRDGDYLGPPLNRVARLLSAGHGGQILATAVVEALAAGYLPADVDLLDLGEHRLKDLARPARVYQVAAPGLSRDFPALRSLDARPNNLPLQLTPLVGREQELADLGALLMSPDARIVTLVGPGGTGKTRLALQAAADALDHFADGVFLADLAPIREVDLVLPTLARAIGVDEEPDRDLTMTLADALRHKRLLVLLDNFEQILPAAPLVSDLLARVAGLTVLVTSRVALQLQGEREVFVEPLATPDPKSLPPIDILTAYAAVQLFTQRATDVKASFAVTPENAAAIAGICARLEGLPLAIELAAARVRMLAPQALLARLDERLPTLAGGRRDLPERQQTMRATIAWSHDLLEPGDQTVFARLGVFAGGWSLEAADAVAGADGGDVFSSLDRLVLGSLVRSRELATGETRFEMLELVREFALGALDDEAAAAARRAHAEWFAGLCEEFEEDAYRHGGEEAWTHRLDLEAANLRAARDWCAANGDAAGIGLRLAANSSRYWLGRGRLRDHAEAIEAALALAREGGSRDPHTEAQARYWRCAAVLNLRDAAHTDARRELERLTEVFADQGDERRQAWTLNDRGLCAMEEEDLEAAERLFEASMVIRRASRDVSALDLAVGGGNLGEVSLLRGDLSRAKELFLEARRIARDAGWQDIEAETLKDLASASRQCGALDEATAYAVASLRLTTIGVGPVRAVRALSGLVAIQSARGLHREAAVLAGVVDSALADMHCDLERIDRVPYTAACEASRRAIGDATWGASYAEGSLVELGAAVRDVLARAAAPLSGGAPNG